MSLHVESKVEVKFMLKNISSEHKPRTDYEAS